MFKRLYDWYFETEAKPEEIAYAKDVCLMIGFAVVTYAAIALIVMGW